MYVISFFTNNGAPVTGLTPTIRIRDLSDNSLVVTDVSMSEVGDGWYKYNFSTYDDTKEYAIRVDGGATLNNIDRYKYAGSEGAETNSIVSLVKQLREGNISFEYVCATVQNDTRKVEIGKLDHIIIKIKNDTDSDWSSPVNTKTLYMWYETLGDDNPQYVKESN